METQKKPIEFKKLYNNTPEDFTFFYDSAPYTIKAGETKDFIDYIAVHGAMKLADKYSKTSNGDEKKVLVASFLENIDPVTMSKKLGIDLDKIRKDVLTREKEKARVINLESQVADLNKKLEAVLAKVEKKEEVKEEGKIDKRTKDYKQSLKEE
jgi:hypothetical protein